MTTLPLAVYVLQKSMCGKTLIASQRWDLSFEPKDSVPSLRKTGIEKDLLECWNLSEMHFVNRWND